MQPVVQPAVQRVVSCIRGFNKNLREALQSQPSNPGYTLATQIVVITALHVMQTRYSDESSVRPSVRPSVTRVDCDKTEERSVQIFIPFIPYLVY